MITGSKDIDKYLDNLDKLDPDSIKRVHSLLKHLKETRGRAANQASFLSFVKSLCPAFIDVIHHKLMCEAF